MPFRPHRLLPSIAVGGLLTFAILGATDPRARRSPAVPASLYYPMCTALLESASPAESTMNVPNGEGIVQPFQAVGNIAACSLAVNQPYYWTSSYGVSQVQSWDPVALAPDPTDIALRQTSMWVSGSYGWLGKESYVPPIVLKSSANVAEAPRTTAAWSFTTLYTSGFEAHWAANAPANVPVGYHFVGNGPRVPLNGPHGALGHWTCGGDGTLQSLLLLQSVVRCDSAYGTDKNVIVQRFRVTQRMQLYWVELAFKAAVAQNPGGMQPGTVAILDAEGQPQPPNTTASALCVANFNHDASVTSWGSHYDFDLSIELVPHHDYWLWVRTIQDYSLFVRHRAAVESVPFEAGTGELWFLNGSSPPWTRDPGNTLAFKVVGLPLDAASVAPKPPAVSTLRLRAAPNPARGSSLLAWSGAHGALRIQVLDARGRRVAQAAIGGGAAGQWLFRGANDDGRPLPAGVYFVRALDAGGQAAVERVVLVR